MPLDPEIRHSLFATLFPTQEVTSPYSKMTKGKKS